MDQGGRNHSCARFITFLDAMQRDVGIYQAFQEAEPQIKLAMDAWKSNKIPMLNDFHGIDGGLVENQVTEMDKRTW